MAENDISPRRSLRQAVWIEEPRLVKIKTEEQEETFRLENDNVRIRTLYSGISSGTEMLFYRGEVPRNHPPDPGLVTSSNFCEPTFSYPAKYGYCNVGRVVEVGSQCNSLQEDDIVFTLSPHETEVIATEQSCTRLSKSLNPLLGVFTANVETALGVIHDSQLSLGENVFVIGLGVVGMLVCLLAAKAGAKVTGIEKLQNRRRIASSVGINLTENIGEHAAEADVIIEASGSPNALQQAIDLAGFESRIVVASWYGSKEVILDLGSKFHRDRIKIISSQVSHINPLLRGRWNKKRRLGLVTTYLDELNLSPLVTHIFPFKDAEKAFQKVDRDPGSTLQVILDYQEKGED